MDCVSPIDGRYKEITKCLSRYFSEFSFFKYRLYIELEYFCHLSKFIPELDSITSSNRESIMKIWRNFCEEDYNIIKEKENVLKHDIKALEYFIKAKFVDLNLSKYVSFIHFGLTSQDINTSANVLAFKDCMNIVILPYISQIILHIELLSNKTRRDIMLGFTHGQPAVPTTMGKELYVFLYRLEEQLNILVDMPYTTKFGGAVGNFNAHYMAYPDLKWEMFADKFIRNIGLKREQVTTQISNYDKLCNIFNHIKTINCIVNDLNIDCWLYISKGYLKQKVIENEIGSSTMPQKVNPINFENSEGNICIANSLIEGITRKLSISRLQRDLTDSTILRNIGSLLGYSYISYTSTVKGLERVDIDKDKIFSDLMTNYSVISEGIQTILRKHNDTNAYEKLHQLTRKGFDKNEFNQFILSLPENIQKEIRIITPFTYYGHNSTINI